MDFVRNEGLGKMEGLLFFFVQFYQDDVVSYLLDVTEGDYVFFLMSQKAPDRALARDDDCKHSSRADIEVYISHKAKALAVADIDYLFLFQVADSHFYSLRNIGYFSICRNLKRVLTEMEM